MNVPAYRGGTTESMRDGQGKSPDGRAVKVRSWWPDLDLWVPIWSLWEIYLAVAAVGTAVTVTYEDRSATARTVTLALLACLAVWYVWWGRPLMRAEIEDWRGYVYALGVLLLFVPTLALTDGSALLMFALCPQPYMVMRSLPATVSVAALATSQVVVHLANGGDLATTLAEQVPSAVVVTVVSMVLGTGARAFSRKNHELAALNEELNNSRAETARLSHEAGVAAERQRMSAEIHDTIAQGLALQIMLLRGATNDLERNPSQARRRLELATNTAIDNLREARDLVAALAPSALAEASLSEVLARLVERFAAETDLAARWCLTGTPTSLPTSVEVALLRAAQESLANARKHADATSVRVDLDYRTDVVVLTIRDDGKGFVPSESGDGYGYGLTGMRNRVAQISGTLRVESAPGAGTTITVQAPV